MTPRISDYDERSYWEQLITRGIRECENFLWISDQDSYSTGKEYDFANPGIRRY